MSRMYRSFDWRPFGGWAVILRMAKSDLPLASASDTTTIMMEPRVERQVYNPRLRRAKTAFWRRLIPRVRKIFQHLKGTAGFEKTLSSESQKA